MKEDVLLSVRGEDSQPEAVGYALSLCRDMGARLTVLAVAEEDATNTHWLCVQERLRKEMRARMLPALEAALAQAARVGVECRVASRIGDFCTEVAAFAASLRPHLLLVACPPPGKLPLRWCQQMACDLLGRLNCPVVSLVPWESNAYVAEEVRSR